MKEINVSKYNDNTRKLNSLMNELINYQKLDINEQDTGFIKPGDFIFFGSENSGLPAEFLNDRLDNAITIPMTKEGRSLNLAISTGIILYDAIKQNFTTYKELM